ncbi:MAG: MerR family transcriptional regulator [Rikenellaceae bacterium]|nr:MerR family transcriptional regulator [Rikenellaceae bacterium]
MAIKKLYYSMGEVAEMFDVNRSLIRHWETKFDCLRPHKNKKGNRMFTPEDVEKLKQIYHLVKEQGMTLEGANKVMRASSKGLSREADLLEHLQRIRSILVEVRDGLGSAEDEQLLDSDTPAWEEPATDEPTEPRKSSRVVKIESEVPQEPEEKAAKPRRAPRRKKSDDENKELFPFYEQSLF